MRRRDFITLAGGAAVWPFTARAQQHSIPIVGFFRSTREHNFEKVLAASVRTGLKEVGYVEGENISFEYRWANEQREQLPALAGELIQKPVTVIVANSVAALAAKAATRSVPIVFVSGGDPAKEGLVKSFNRPEGNVTGVTFLGGQTAGKRLELLRQFVPNAKKIAVLVDPTTNEAERRELHAAARAAELQLVVIEVRTDRDLESAFETIVQSGARAILIGSGAFLTSLNERLVSLTLRHRLPAIRNIREFAAAGGLVSYGSSLTDAYRQGGVYAGRILKGERTNDLPVLQATKFELVVNLKAAKELGVTIPLQIHAAADEVIE